MFKKLYKKILTNNIFDINYLQSINIDELLDLRDEKEFDDEWMRNYYSLQNCSISEELIQQINLIQEVVFKRIYKYTESDDLSAYVSDDFELLCKAYAVGNNDSWLTQMAHVYSERKIPCGKLAPATGKYNEEFLKIFEK